MADPWTQASAHILLGEDSGPERGLLTGAQLPELGLSLLPSGLAHVHGPQLTRAEQAWAEQGITEAAWEGLGSQTTDPGPYWHQEPWKAVRAECYE